MSESTEVSTRITPEQQRASYNKLVRVANLSNILLSDIKFNVKPEMLSVDKGSMKRSINSSVSDVFYDPEDGVSISKIRWRLQMKDGKKTLLLCDATYVVCYDNIKGFDKGIVDIFAENVAKVSSYAYFRGLYAHVDWSASVNSPPLPVFRANPKV